MADKHTTSSQAEQPDASGQTRPDGPAAATQKDKKSSILGHDGSQYAYAAAETAALNMSEPWRVATALGRDALFSRSNPPAKGGRSSIETPNNFVHETKDAVKHPASADAEQNTVRAPAVPDPKLTDEEHDPKYLDKLSKSSGSSVASGDMASSASHYDPSNDVILRLETMSAVEARVLSFLLWTGLIMALGFLVYEFAQKLIDGNFVLRNFDTLIINSVVGGVCFLLVTGSLCIHCFRLVACHMYGKVWKPKRWKVVVYTSVELFAQWTNLLCFQLINWINFGPGCFKVKSPANLAWIALVRWTAWNTLFLLSLMHAHNTCPISRDDADSLPELTSVKSSVSGLLGKTYGGSSDMVVMDLPFFQAHWWKLIIWAVMECSVVAVAVYYAVTTNAQQGITQAEPLKSVPGRKCGEQYVACRTDNTEMGLVSIMIFFTLLYFVLYIFFIRRALRRLHKRPRSEFKMGNIIVRLQMRLRLPAFTFFILSLLLLWYVKPFSCTSVVFTWFGMLPGQLAATVAVLLMTFVCQPLPFRKTKPVLQVWLQEFAWLESEKARKMARRNSSLPPDQVEEIAKEPMFCMETMMTALYWSLLAYDYQEVEDTKLSLEEGFALYDPPLEHFELFWEKSLDTKMLLAWNREVILLSFRGTASMSNVFADIQAFRVAHKPVRGNFWSRPKVHRGFQAAWRNNSLHDRVIDRIKEIINSGYIVTKGLRFHVTGHSLGGALATLAAYDVRAVGLAMGKDPRVSCYTFGAPRTGNHSFAREYERICPDTWHIINDQDVVARGAKFLVLYKRGGQRVLINEQGDMIVRPNPIEASLHLVPCSGSVAQHLLTSYLRSLLVVMVAQFSHKRIKGGMTGVVQLAQRCKPIQKLLLDEANLNFDDLVEMERNGTSAAQVAKIQDATFTGRENVGGPGKAGTYQMEGELPTNARGGLLFSCCRPLPEGAKDARGGEETVVRKGGT